METIEQLKQDNAKLTERLNNAAKFFREQKAQIENLTKKNDELKHDAESFNLLQESYENNIKSKDQAYKLLQDTYNEVFAENKKLTEEIKEQTKFESDVINTKVPELEEKLKNSEAAYEELRKKYVEIKELHDGDLNRYNELEDNYEKLQNKFKENDIAKGEAELRLENIQTEYIKKFEEQKNIIESKDKAYKLLQNKYDEVFGALNNHKKDIELKEKFAKDCDELNKFNIELKDKVDKLNKLYDSCENEKLAVQADYELLKEKYNELKINAEAYEEAAREYEDIYEDYEKYKEFINALFTKAKEVNITWFSPQEIENKQENKPVEQKSETSKVTVEYKKTTSNTDKGRVINQEMNVPGYTINI